MVSRLFSVYIALWMRTYVVKLTMAFRRAIHETHVIKSAQGEKAMTSKLHLGRIWCMCEPDIIDIPDTLLSKVD